VQLYITFILWKITEMYIKLSNTDNYMKWPLSLRIALLNVYVYAIDFPYNFKQIRVRLFISPAGHCLVEMLFKIFSKGLDKSAGSFPPFLCLALQLLDFFSNPHKSLNLFDTEFARPSAKLFVNSRYLRFYI